MNRNLTLIGKSSNVNVTQMRREFNAARPGESAFGPEERTGPMRSTPIPFNLIGGAPPLVIAAMNKHRKGLMIQNHDPVATLWVGFGQLAGVGQFALPPLSVVLLDFTCPTDTISAFSTVNCNGFCVEMCPTD